MFGVENKDVRVVRIWDLKFKIATNLYIYYSIAVVVCLDL